jgi:hypothetical protein
MRSFLTLVIALIFVVGSAAQDVKQQVISSAGGFSLSNDNSISLSWTLGELAISTLKSSDDQLILTQGFQQSKVLIDAITVYPELGVDVSIYPNPTSGIVYIKLSSPLDNETNIYLTSPNGSEVLRERLFSGDLLKQIDMNGFPSGTYFLRIQNGIKINVYKIIKL